MVENITDSKPGAWIPTVFAMSVFAVICGLVIIYPHIELGFPRGHNFWNNYFWYESFKDQIFAGELYPRWLLNQNAGLGGPVFYFYAPLPFYLFTCITWILGESVSSLTILTMGHFCMLLFSGLTFYCLIRKFASPFWSIATSVLYMFLPYHYLDLEVRCAVGESWAYVWIPFILSNILHNQVRTKHLLWGAIGYGCLVLSHLPSALLAIPIIVIFGLINRDQVKLLPATGRLLVVGVLGLMLSASYGLPALVLQTYLPFDAWIGSYGSDFHPVSWLIGYDHPKPSFAPIVYLALTASTLMAGLVMGAFYLVNRLHNANDRQDSLMPLIWSCMVSIALCWFMMSNLSQVIWVHVPFLAQVQFPWRIGVTIDVCSALLVGLLAPKILDALCLKFDRSGITIRIGGYVAMILLLVMVTGGVFTTYFPSTVATVEPERSPPNLIEYRTKWQVESRQYLMSSTVRDLSNPELAPAIHRHGHLAWSNFVKRLPIIDPRRNLSETESVYTVDDHDGYLSIAADLATTATIRVKKLYFPHWYMQAQESDHEISTYPDPQTGLLLCDLPAGKHRFTLQKKQLKPELIGNLISLITGLLVVGMIIKWGYASTNPRG